MSWLTSQLRWLMLVAGALTCTMLYATINPQAALLSNFGVTLEGPVAEIVVRNWGALITLVGGMLIYGALVPAARRLVLSAAVLSKATFIGLVLCFDAEWLNHQIRIAVFVDTIWVLLFGAYLVGTGHPER
ncbi:MAG: hypothetical protein KA267_08320 [Gemmatimonadales bacterium]|jgi:hypothetical protein|nr:hypothetical protein [Gemmatimonadales bacterium]MBP6571013.1 hypothetical protein [Gemmatimonadales bacterium]MBP7619944.1 hypothetical protein [Gemmatimonadales bacterium]MBP9899720.1 hypothetical protein [Gemmatimonadales bacterium]